MDNTYQLDTYLQYKEVNQVTHVVPYFYFGFLLSAMGYGILVSFCLLWVPIFPNHRNNIIYIIIIIIIIIIYHHCKP